MTTLRFPLPAIAGVVVSAFTFSATAFSQTTLHTVSDASLTLDYGRSASGLDDVTGDGRPDFVVAQPAEDGGPAGVRVYNGATGALVHSPVPPLGASNYGFALSRALDIDGDGVKDFLVGAPGLPSVLPVIIPGVIDVVSGQTGLSIRSVTGPGQIQLGHAVASMDDINGDGTPDFAGGAVAASVNGTMSGAVFAFSGASGVVLWSVDGDAAQDAFGHSLARISDVDGDQVADLIAGAPGGQYVDLLSGVDGSQIRRLVAPGTIGGNFGWAVDAAGDVNNDGIEEVLVGSPSEDQNGSQSGAARLLSGATGAILRTTHGGFTNDHVGWSVSGAGDLDFDGVPDQLIGAPEFGSSSFFPTGVVRVVSGMTGNTLYFQHGSGIAAEFGASVDFVGDTNGNGLLAFIGGSTGLHEAHLVETDPGAVGTNFCTSEINSTGERSAIGASGSDSLAANNLRLRAGPMAGGEPGIFFYGADAIQVPFGNGFRCVGGTPVFRLFPIAIASPSGALTFELDNTALPAGGSIVPSQVVKFQAWFRDPAGGGAGFDLSDGLSITFQP